MTEPNKNTHAPIDLFHLSFQGGQNGCIIIITAIILITQTRTRNISMFQHSRFDSLQLRCHGFSEGGSLPASLLTVKGCRDSADAVLSGSWVQDALCCRRRCRARASRMFWRCGNRLPSAASGLTYINSPRELYLGDNCSTN